MNELNEYANEEDRYIYDIIALLGTKYTRVETLRGAWVVTFIYYKDDIRKESKVKKEVLNYNRSRNKLPLTIRNLMK
jgi:hypothetical protein